MSIMSRKWRGWTAAVLAVTGVWLIVRSGTTPPHDRIAATSNSQPAFGILVNPATAIVLAVHPGETAVANYELRNPGQRPAEIVSVATTCGCTLAAPLAENAIRPGKSQQLAIHATPPAFGERLVAIHVRLAMDGRQETLTLPLVLRGHSISGERVIEIPSNLELLSAESGTVERTFEIMTMEQPDSARWLQALASDDPMVRADVTSVETGPSRRSGVVRTYRCRVTAAIPESRDQWYAATIRLLAERPTTTPLPTIRAAAASRLRRHASGCLLGIGTCCASADCRDSQQ